MDACFFIFFLNSLSPKSGKCVGLGRIGQGITIDRNPIQSQEIWNKYKIGADHLMDYLEKRLVLGN